MKISYKIALILSVMVCLLTAVIFMGKTQPEPIQAVDAQTNQTATPPPRKTLRADSTGDGSLKSMVNAQTNSNTDTPAKTIAADARSRVLATLTPDTNNQSTASSTSDSDKPQAATPSSPLGNGTSAAIALARTDSNPAKHTNKPAPSAKVSSHDLDAVLASSDRPNVPWPNKTNATAAKTSTATTNTSKTYTVQSGDVLSSIAIKIYNDERRWVDIAQANPKVEPTKLRVGQVLRLPNKRHTLSKEEPSPPGPGTTQTYTIQPGDSLSTVAQQYYGDPTLWRTIYNFNRDIIGDNPNAIKANMQLQVPPKLTGAQ